MAATKENTAVELGALLDACDAAVVTLVAAFNLIKANVQVMAAAVLNQPKDVAEVSRLLADPPAETSAPPPADSGTSHQPSTRPHSGDCSRHSGTPASAAPSAAATFHIPPPDYAYVSQLRSLPAEVKNWRLREVAGEGAVAELDALLAAGADVAATDKQKWTALHWAVREGHVEAARLLIARGAPVDAINSWQRTPLYLAARHGHAPVVRLLLAASADHSARACHGWTPLLIAEQNNHKQVVDLLSER